MMRMALVAFGTAALLGGCALLGDVIFDRYGTFLTGGSIAHGQKGHRYGSGHASAWIERPPYRFCYSLSVAKVDGVTAAHLHRGPATSVGMEVLTLRPPVDGRSDGCLSPGRAILRQIKARPESFYIDIHSAEFPEGAIRGQLQRNSPDVRAPIR
ncbi:MAG TPA: CHRD domain-containing protein [Allosphingosinicella sp.]|uniref:CHRD domain-containing protein n=1 Tax=Allosphingosinicella sp. TaxID=2823234 RepID=UPI002ED9481C